MRKLTQQRLKELLIYNLDTGIFIRNTSFGGQEIGDVAGTRHPNGNIYIRVDNEDTKYLAHILAYLYMTGEYPEFDIDHKDNNRSNNRWLNLRPATRSQNKANILHIPGISGVRGVWLHRGRYRAAIKINQKRIHLGVFDTIEEASAAYLMARHKYFGEFNPKEMFHD